MRKQSKKSESKKYRRFDGLVYKRRSSHSTQELAEDELKKLTLFYYRIVKEPNGLHTIYIRRK